MECRLCQGQVRKFLDLGETPLPEEFRLKSELGKSIVTYPLNLVYCLDCRHVQLGFKVPVELIYKQNYFYDYSITKTGLKHWQKLAKKLHKDNDLSKTDLVVDVGSNTGTLLSLLKLLNTTVVGVDPTSKLVKISRKSGIPTINDYFTLQVAKNIIARYGRAKVITCTNTFDHVDDLNEFMKGITMLLRKDGVFIIEVPYFLNMIKNLSHIVYHQQVDYLMIKTLIPFIKKFNLEIFDVEPIPIHGGSIRIFVRREGKGVVKKRLYEILDEEDKFLKHWDKILKQFSQNVLRQRKTLKKLVQKLKSENKKIAAVGASAKGITLLNYCGLGPNEVEFISEKSPLKIGRFTPSGIPIVSDTKLISKKPDYAIMLAYNFQNEVIINLREYGKLGKFIIPIPKIEFK